MNIAPSRLVDRLQIKFTFEFFDLRVCVPKGSRPASGRRVQHGNQGAKRPKSFVGEVMQAEKKAGRRRQTFRRSGGTTSVRPPLGPGHPAGVSSS
jgi:hypothetical protein